MMKQINEREVTTVSYRIISIINKRRKNDGNRRSLLEYYSNNYHMQNTLKCM